jgi:hypothetical protein
MRVQWFWHHVADSRSMSYGDHCAICRKLMDGPCSDCAPIADAAEVERRLLKREMFHETWMTMLLIRQRCVPNLPRELLMCILNMAWHEGFRMRTMGCHWWLVPACGHMFHFHCLRRWGRKRAVCPLDSGPIDPNAEAPEHVITESSWRKSFGVIVRLKVNL